MGPLLAAPASHWGAPPARRSRPAARGTPELIRLGYAGEGNRLLVAPAFAQDAMLASDPWMRELAYRQMVLATYDGHEDGRTEDNIDGGIIVNAHWFNIAHPLVLRWILAAMGRLPEEPGTSREKPPRAGERRGRFGGL